MITIRKAGYIITSGSTPNFSINNGATADVYYNDFGATTTTTVPADTDLTLNISDSQQQTLPAGTNVFISTTALPDGSEEPTYTIGNTVGATNPDDFGGLVHSFNSGSATAIYILVETPKSVSTSTTLPFNP